MGHLDSSSFDRYHKEYTAKTHVYVPPNVRPAFRKLFPVQEIHKIAISRLSEFSFLFNFFLFGGAWSFNVSEKMLAKCQWEKNNSETVNEFLQSPTLDLHLKDPVESSGNTRFIKVGLIINPRPLSTLCQF